MVSIPGHNSCAPETEVGIRVEGLGTHLVGTAIRPSECALSVVLPLLPRALVTSTTGKTELPCAAHLVIRELSTVAIPALNVSAYVRDCTKQARLRHWQQHVRMQTRAEARTCQHRIM